MISEEKDVGEVGTRPLLLQMWRSYTEAGLGELMNWQDNGDPEETKKKWPGHEKEVSGVAELSRVKD